MASFSTCLLFLMLYSSVRANLTEFSAGCQFKSAVLSTNKISKDSEKSAYWTNIQTSISPKETLCFELNTNLDQTHKTTSNRPTNSESQRFLRLKLVQIYQKFEFKDTYKFSIPVVEAKCLCDCPGGPDRCYKNYESSCSTNSADSLCFRQYSNGHRAASCFAFAHTSELCCEITISKSELGNDFYVAGRLVNPQTYYKFQYALLDGKGTILSENKASVSLEASQIQLALSKSPGELAIRGTSIHSPLPMGWYFVHPYSNSLMTGEPINEKNENDLKKLGWFKFYDNITLFPIKMDAVQNTFKPQVHNCRDDDFSWNFDGANYWKTKAEAKSLPSIGDLASNVHRSTVESIRVSKDKSGVFVTYRESSPITLDLSLHFQADIIFHYASSSFQDFTATIEVDEFGNRMVVIFLIQAKGRLYGEISNSALEETQHITLLVNSTKPVNTPKMTYKISSKVKSESKVCIRADKSPKICKPAPYKEVPRKDLVSYNKGFHNGSKTAIFEILLKYLQRHLATVEEKPATFATGHAQQKRL